MLADDASQQPITARAAERTIHTPQALDPRIAPLVADLEIRLRPVLSDMPPALFAQIVHDIAAVKLRWTNESRVERVR